MVLNKEWMNIKNRSSRLYISGVDDFLNFAFRDIEEENKDSVTIRCPCNSCRNIIFKRRGDVRFDLFKCGVYEKYTTWEFHGESINYSDSDNISNRSNYDDDNHDSEVNMLDDAFGIASMNVDMGTGIGNEQRMPEVPNDEAPKFYRLLKEYQEPLMTTLRGYSKGQHQLLQQKEMQKQQQIIQEQAQRIKELEEMQEQHKKELEKIREQNKKELLEQQQHAMDVFKQEMMDMFARRVE